MAPNSIELTSKEKTEYKRNIELREMKEEAQSKLEFCDEAALRVLAANADRMLAYKAFSTTGNSIFLAVNEVKSLNACYAIAEYLWRARQRFVEAEKDRIKTLETTIIRRNRV